jgi:hypothetical protein
VHVRAVPRVQVLEQRREQLDRRREAVARPHGRVGRQATDQRDEAPRAGFGELDAQVEAIEALEVGLERVPAVG